MTAYTDADAHIAQLRWRAWIALVAVVCAFGLVALDRKSTRLNSSHIQKSRMPSSA